MNEIYKPVAGYPQYEISNLGNSRTKDRYTGGKNNHFRKGQKMNPWLNIHGYPILSLWHENKQKRMLLHRLVALHFIPNPDNKPMVNHKNGIKTDCRVDNIEWCTRRENEDHAMENGLKARGEQNGTSKLTEREVIAIRDRFDRGERQRDIVKDYPHVAQTQIYRVCRRKTWRHIA